MSEAIVKVGWSKIFFYEAAVFSEDVAGAMFGREDPAPNGFIFAVYGIICWQSAKYLPA
jgi:hypothetical protein